MCSSIHLLAFSGVIFQPDEQVEVELLKKAVRMMAYAMAELAQAEEVNEWM